MQCAYHDACVSVGYPACADHNEPHTSGIGAIPMNRVERRRQSNLLVYLEPARSNPNLAVRGDAHVRRILFDGRRVIGVEISEFESEWLDGRPGSAEKLVDAIAPLLS